CYAAVLEMEIKVIPQKKEVYKWILR
ncbi:hypothetical protein LCGC14_2474910, partial [marine sediment metagenome]